MIVVLSAKIYLFEWGWGEERRERKEKGDDFFRNITPNPTLCLMWAWPAACKGLLSGWLSLFFSYELLVKSTWNKTEQKIHHNIYMSFLSASEGTILRSDCKMRTENRPEKEFWTSQHLVYIFLTRSEVSGTSFISSWKVQIWGHVQPCSKFREFQNKRELFPKSLPSRSAF